MASLTAHLTRQAPPQSRAPPSPCRLRLCPPAASAAAAAPHAARSGRPATSPLRPARTDTAAASSDASLLVPRYRRVLLKLSGEGLAGAGGMGVDPAVLKRVACEIATAVARGVEVAIVVGGGNYYRGAADVVSSHGVDRATGDYVGMLATVMNAVLLQGALEREGVPTRVQTAIEMRQVAEPYIRRRAMRHLERGRVVIFGAGTGNPFFTTDTAAALRAAEIGADAVLKATKVDGVYDRDPASAGPGEAILLDSVSYAQVRAARLGVMDETASTLADDNGIAAVVFNMLTPGHITRALCGEAGVGTAVTSANGNGNGNGNGSGGGGSSGGGPALVRAPTVTKVGPPPEGPAVGC